MRCISSIIPSLVLVTSLAPISVLANDLALSSASRRAIDPNRVTVDLKPVVDGLQRPVAVRSPGDGSGRLFVVEQPGRIRVVESGELQSTPFLDITDRVRDSSTEQGLLGLAFHPDFSSNGRFFVNYTDLAGDTVVSEFARAAGESNLADSSSEAIVMTIEQPFSNHNGGDVAFGPEGYFWIATGDGGGGGDPQGNGQNTETLLGKMLRVDVDHGTTYTVPPDNPFVEDPGVRNEIWALGLRNPWRFSFDRETGDLFIGDVGQNQWEEIDFEPKTDPGGRNYGWNTMEGGHCFQTGACETNDLTLPIFEYSHSAGCSVTGGYVYRGAQFPSLDGLYLFGDFCSGAIWALAPEGPDGWTAAVVGRTDASIAGFGEDEDGELYLTDLGSGTVFRIVGRALSPSPRRPSRRTSPVF